MLTSRFGVLFEHDVTPHRLIGWPRRLTNTSEAASVA